MFKEANKIFDGRGIMIILESISLAGAVMANRALWYNFLFFVELLLAC